MGNFYIISIQKPIPTNTATIAVKMGISQITVFSTHQIPPNNNYREEKKNNNNKSRNKCKDNRTFLRGKGNKRNFKSYNFSYEEQNNSDSDSDSSFDFYFNIATIFY